MFRKHGKMLIVIGFLFCFILVIAILVQTCGKKYLPLPGLVANWSEWSQEFHSFLLNGKELSKNNELVGELLTENNYMYDNQKNVENRLIFINDTSLNEINNTDIEGNSHGKEGVVFGEISEDEANKENSVLGKNFIESPEKIIDNITPWQQALDGSDGVIRLHDIAQINEAELEGKEHLEGIAEPEDKEQTEGLDESEDKEQPEGTGEPEDKEQPEGTGEPEDKEQPEGTGQSEDKEQPEGTGQSEDKEQTEGLDESEDKEQTEGLDESEDKEQSEGTTESEDKDKTEGTGELEDDGQLEGIAEPGDEEQTEPEELPENEDPEIESNETLAKEELSSNASIVYSFDELKSVLQEDNGITHIYLGADIAMEAGGIKININKSELVIDGVDPTDPNSTVHLFEEYSTQAQHESLYVPEKSILKNITLKNMNVIGRNYYGYLSVSDSLYGVVTTYENINYVGPQITYNRHGTAKYIDCDITIDDKNGGSPMHEVAEATYIIMGGTIKITHLSESYRVFWMDYNEGSITVLPDANVNIYVKKTTLSYNPNVRADITIGNNAVFEYSASERLGEHLFGSLTVEEGAICRIVTRDFYGATAVRLAGDLNVREGAVFQVIANTSAPYLVVLFNNKSAYFDNPKQVLLYNNNKNTIGWNSGGNLYIRTQQLNYWRTPGADSPDNPPLYHWEKIGGDLTVNGYTPIGSNFPTLTSNLTEEDNNSNGVLLNEKTFELSTSRVISFGTLELTADLFLHPTPHVTGVTEPEAILQLEYQKNGVTNTINAAADQAGNYSIELDSELDVGTELIVTAVKNYLTSSVTINMEGELAFVSVPPVLEFQTSVISNMVKRIGRFEKDWKLIISDTRQNASQWKLTARLDYPLTNINDPEKIISDGIIFVDSNHISNTLKMDEDTLIYEYSGSGKDNNIAVEWAEDEGIMAEIKPGEAYTSGKYHAGIQWNLVDAP